MLLNYCFISNIKYKFKISNFFSIPPFPFKFLLLNFPHISHYPPKERPSRPELRPPKLLRVYLGILKKTTGKKIPWEKKSKIDFFLF